MARSARARYLVDRVGPETPARKAARRTLLSKAEPMFELEAAALSGADADAVHDMRVASRRTREALSVFEPVFKAKAAATLRASIKRVTKSLGPVRDADVFIAEFTHLAEEPSSDAERTALAYLIERRSGERVAHLERARRSLRTLDLPAMRREFRAAAKATRSKGTAALPLRALADTVLRERVAAVYALAPAAALEHESAAQHRMRIACKHLRYAVETFAPCFGNSFSRVHRTLVAFQDVLGEMHDRDVFLAQAREHFAAPDAAGSSVPEEGVRAVEARLAAERHRLFRRFSRLLRRYPEHVMLERVLGGLTTIPAEKPVPPATSGAKQTGALAT